jgi:hypothetical protein
LSRNEVHQSVALRSATATATPIGLAAPDNDFFGCVNRGGRVGGSGLFDDIYAPLAHFNHLWAPRRQTSYLLLENPSHARFADELKPHKFGPDRNPNRSPIPEKVLGAFP